MSKSGRASLEHRAVVCPHCWHDFHDDEAWFISRHPELVGDPVIADPEAFRRFGPHEVTLLFTEAGELARIDLPDDYSLLEPTIHGLQ